MKMLNEMNPKLRALLAAGLIGTAGLGAVSCSMPTDDPVPIEKPKETVTFKSLGVSDYAESLARAIKKGSAKQIADTPFDDFIYDLGEHKFVSASFNNGDYTGPEVDDCIYYVDTLGKKTFYVPASMESDFDTAIAAYKAAHAE